VKRNSSSSPRNAEIHSRQIGMLQVDLAQHSALSKAMAPGLVMAAKMELARQLEHHLLSRGLQCLAWAGDGGIFWTGVRHRE
jgi:hypothetical protein